MEGIAIYPALVMPALVTRDLVHRRCTACFLLFLLGYVYNIVKELLSTDFYTYNIVISGQYTKKASSLFILKNNSIRVTDFFTILY